MYINQQVEEFIHKRFPEDNNWLNGNCYWFAQILHQRFEELTIYYDYINGHFFVAESDDGPYYDWSGEIVQPEGFMRWAELQHLDPLWGEHLWRDCAC